MSSTSLDQIEFETPIDTNYVSQGKGSPVILVHGLAASLHDWDLLLPRLMTAGYTGYALDLLGHGESPKPEVRAYPVDWLFDHFVQWLDSLNLSEPAVLIGHSLGAYLALEYARRFPSRTRGLVLVNPFYSRDQLPFILRQTNNLPFLRGLSSRKTPGWLLRVMIDISSISMGLRAHGLHSLTPEVRLQTALDYARTAPGVYDLLNTLPDLMPSLASIQTPTLVVWGERDQTLAPSSFFRLLNTLPNATGEHVPAGHVPHQSNSDWFIGLVLDFLQNLG
jgi:pimeloyl-ACP methyl ester carboxylesterase